jgi:hypothetical protein
VRLCRDVAKEGLIVTPLKAGFVWWRSALPSLAPRYCGDGRRSPSPKDLLVGGSLPSGLWSFNRS